MGWLLEWHLLHSSAPRRRQWYLLTWPPLSFRPTGCCWRRLFEFNNWWYACEFVAVAGARDWLQLPHLLDSLKSHLCSSRIGIIPHQREHLLESKYAWSQCAVATVSIPSHYSRTDTGPGPATSAVGPVGAGSECGTAEWRDGQQLRHGDRWDNGNGEPAHGLLHQRPTAHSYVHRRHILLNLLIRNLFAPVAHLFTVIIVCSLVHRDILELLSARELRAQRRRAALAGQQTAALAANGFGADGRPGHNGTAAAAAVGCERLPPHVCGATNYVPLRHVNFLIQSSDQQWSHNGSHSSPIVRFTS